MTNRVLLDNVNHQHMRVADRTGSPVSVNQALVVPSEFENLQREFPILFQQVSDTEFQAVVILGLERGENLFLKDGQWITHCVPATLRRGPLFLAVGDPEQDDDPGIAIDLDDPRVSESEGEPLFLPHGGAAPFLQHAVEALRTVHEGLEVSRAMFALFRELGLIAPVEIDIDLGDGTRYHLPDLFTISADRFESLSGAELKTLHRAGFLAPAIHARSSIGNINRLIELKTSGTLHA